jgi:hypothetical protein
MSAASFAGLDVCSVGISAGPPTLLCQVIASEPHFSCIVLQWIINKTDSARIYSSECQNAVSRNGLLSSTI